MDKIYRLAILNNTQIGPNNHKTCITIHLLYLKSSLVIVCVNYTLFRVIFVLDNFYPKNRLNNKLELFFLAKGVYYIKL